MVKADSWIKKFGLSGGISPYNEANVNPASYDITIGNHWICPTRSPEEFKTDEFIIFPREVVLATSIETIRMPRNVVGDLKLKSTLGRLFLDHSLSGWVDCNFQGQITLELQNLSPHPRTLKKGTRIAQIVFYQMETEPETAYGEKQTGHYQNQKGTTLAWNDVYFSKK